MLVVIELTRDPERRLYVSGAWGPFETAEEAAPYLARACDPDRGATGEVVELKTAIPAEALAARSTPTLPRAGGQG